MPRLRHIELLVALMVALSGSVHATGSTLSATDETALRAGDQAVLDQWIAPREAQHPGQSAFRLMSEGPEAFAIRARSARVAMRSLDIQTFIWQFDLTGKLLAHRVLEAAERGVRVRILIDDIDARNNTAVFSALSAHPNIAVRIFNPFASRRGVLGLIGEGLVDFRRLNRRMHNKSWIVDNRIAIVGGRNLSDAYFDASDARNFTDLDLAMIGPIVRDTSASFDTYWNAPAAVAVETLDPIGAVERALETLKLELGSAAKLIWRTPYGDALLADDAIQRFMANEWPMHWSAKYRFAADDPIKVTQLDRDVRRAEVRRTLLQAVQAMQADLVLVSPYFVPGENITTLLTEAVRAGKRVRVLTNSLVANDISAVHGGYSRYRENLLEGGIELWELKSATDSAFRPDFRVPSGASLHTKALLIDKRRLFVGSYNLDPRSAWLNCEQGVLVESEALAQQMMTLFEQQAGAEHAWHVTLEDGDLHWSDGTESFYTDPHSSMIQRLQAWLVRVLRLEPHL